MAVWRQLIFGVRNLVRRGKHDSEARDEVEQYLHDAEEELRTEGLTAEEARRAVRIAVGDSSRIAARVGS